MQHIFENTGGRHPLAGLPFQAIYDALENEVALGNVNAVVDGPFKLYNYSRDCMYGRKWNFWNICARGLVLDTVRRQIACYTMPKSFNWMECQYLPEGPFVATSKEDRLTL